MERDIYEKLVNWKNNPYRKPLIVDGARQVGKTWIIEDFGKRNYKNIVKIDFRDDNEPALALFHKGYSPERILQQIAFLKNTSIEPEKTLVFFDEIQKRPAILEAMKSFCEQVPQYNIVAAGSMLGFVLMGKNIGTKTDTTPEDDGFSFPVGKVDSLTMYPMNFYEFLNACGLNKLAHLLRYGDPEEISEYHNEFMYYLRIYMYTGGMPEVIKTFTRNPNDIPSVRKKQKELLNGYQHDFSKYNNAKDAEKMKLILNSLPRQLEREIKVAEYGIIESGKHGREYKEPVVRMANTGLIYKVNRTTHMQSPLATYEDETHFKMYPLDCGLLGALANVSAREMILNDGALEEFKGSFAETFVVQQIAASNYNGEIYYFSSENPHSEIDFCLQMDKIVPIEVKWGRKTESKSFSNYLKNNPETKGIRISQKQFGETDQIVSIPHYMIGEYINMKLRQFYEKEVGVLDEWTKKMEPKNIEKLEQELEEKYGKGVTNDTSVPEDSLPKKEQRTHPQIRKKMKI